MHVQAAGVALGGGGTRRSDAGVPVHTLAAGCSGMHGIRGGRRDRELQGWAYRVQRDTAVSHVRAMWRCIGTEVVHVDYISAVQVEATGASLDVSGVLRKDRAAPVTLATTIQTCAFQSAGAGFGLQLL